MNISNKYRYIDEIQTPCFLSVPPVITRSPVDASVIQGSTVNFTCEARGDSNPVITWTKDGQLYVCFLELLFKGYFRIIHTSSLVSYLFKILDG